MLLQERGQDCTARFEAYHPFTNAPRKLLAQFKEVGLSLYSICTFNVYMCVCVWGNRRHPPPPISHTHTTPQNTTHTHTQQVKLPPALLRRHCTSSSSPLAPNGSSAPSRKDPFWETLRTRCRRFLRRKRMEEEERKGGEEEEEEEPGAVVFSSPRPLMGWGVFALNYLLLGLASTLYCYGFLDDGPGKACWAGVGMGVLLWVGGRLGHEGEFVGISLYVCVCEVGWKGGDGGDACMYACTCTRIHTHTYTSRPPLPLSPPLHYTHIYTYKHSHPPSPPPP